MSKRRATQLCRHRLSLCLFSFQFSIAIHIGPCEWKLNVTFIHTMLSLLLAVGSTPSSERELQDTHIEVENFYFILFIILLLLLFFSFNLISMCYFATLPMFHTNMFHKTNSKANEAEEEEEIYFIISFILFISIVSCTVDNLNIFLFVILVYFEFIQFQFECIILFLHFD